MAEQEQRPFVTEFHVSMQAVQVPVEEHSPHLFWKKQFTSYAFKAVLK